MVWLWSAGQDMEVCGELFMLCDVEIPNWGMSAETDIAGDEMGLVMQQVRQSHMGHHMAVRL